MLTFDAESHSYAWHGKPVVNVTRALGLVTDYSRIPESILNKARDEGIAIHRTCELYCKDDLDEASLPAWLVPRLAAFKRFIAECQFRLAASEQKVYHHQHGYAGTLDLDGTIEVPQGRRSITMPVVVDIKRSFYAGRAIGLQTAAYAEALTSEERERGIEQRRRVRFALQLRADGQYRLQPFNDPSDYAAFLACLQVWRLREQLQLPLPGGNA